MREILPFMLGTSVVLSGEALNASQRSVHLEIGTEPGQFTTVIACFIYDDDPQEWLFSFFKKVPVTTTVHTDLEQLSVQEQVMINRSGIAMQLALLGFEDELGFDRLNVPQWLVASGDSINEAIQSYVLVETPNYDEYEQSIRRLGLDADKIDRLIRAARRAHDYSSPTAVEHYIERRAGAGQDRHINL